MGFILLGFTLCLSTLLMLELIEAVRGRLMGLKSWDRNVRIFEPVLHSTWQCRGSLDCLCVDLCNKSYCDVHRAGNGYEIRVHKVNR